MTKLLEIWIRDHGSSAAALGREVGLSRSGMLKIIKGQRRPSVLVMRKLAEVTGIPRAQIRPDLYEAA